MERISNNPYYLGIIFLVIAAAPFLLAAIGFLPHTWLYWIFTGPCILFGLLLIVAGFVYRKRR